MFLQIDDLRCVTRMTTQAWRKLRLCVVVIAAVLAPIGSSFADSIPYTVSEQSAQPTLLNFNATPGTVVVCDLLVPANVGGGNVATRPMFVTGKGWGCYSGTGATQTLQEASDLLIFSARANDNKNPSQAVLCSNLDTIPDRGDSDPACKSINLMIANAAYGIQEAGTEGGLEEFNYDPPGVGFPGYGTVMPGGTLLTVSYDLISDAPRNAAEPASLLLLGIGLAGAAAIKRRVLAN